MAIDISLGIVFLASIFILWYRVSLKIPELIAVPDQVITARFQEDSARLRLFVLHIKTYYKEEKYKPVFWKFIGKMIYRLHLILLKLDNGAVSLLKKVRAHGVAINGNGEGNGDSVIKDGDYWQKLQNTPSVPVKNTRVVEVRKRDGE